MRFFNLLETFAVCVVGLTLVCVVLLQVLSRFQLGDYISLAWTDEVARGMLIWLTFIGASMLERQRDHIRVTIFIDGLSEKGRLAADICADILIAVYLVLVLVSSIATLEVDLKTLMVSLPVPMFFISVSLSLGCIGILVRLIERMIRETKLLLTH